MAGIAESVAVHDARLDTIDRDVAEIKKDMKDVVRQPEFQRAARAILGLQVLILSALLALVFK